jgi:hypothetical protein
VVVLAVMDVVVSNEVAEADDKADVEDAEDP